LPDVKEQFAKMGIQPVGGSVAETEKFIADERALWGDVIRKTKLTMRAPSTLGCTAARHWVLRARHADLMKARQKLTCS
jgi:hypothetical protein